MADFDPSIISAISNSTPDTGANMERGMNIKALFDQSQLNSLHVKEEKRSSKEREQVDSILKGSDYSSPEGLAATAQKVNKVSPRSAMDLMKQGQAYQSGQVQQQMDQLELAGKRQDLIVSAIDPLVAQARDMKTKGSSDLEIKAFLTQQMPQALEQLRGMKMSDGKPALPDDILKMATSVPGGYTLPTLEAWENKTKQGQQMVKQRLEQFKADTTARGHDETERHNKAMETNATRRETRMERDPKGNLTPEAVDLAAQRLINGEAARDVLANFGRGKQGGQDIAAVQNRFATLAKDQGLTADEIALRQQEMRGSARAELALGEREGKIAPRVQEAKQFAKLALAASENVPRGDWKMMSQVQQWISDQASGKALGKFQAANVSLINAYAAAIGGGQIHQHDQEVGAKLLSTANGKENYQAKVEQLITETETALAAPEEVKHQWRQTRALDTERRAGRAPPENSPVAGSPPTPSPRSPDGAPAAGGAPKGALTPGNTYKHVGGAHVEIID